MPNNEQILLEIKANVAAALKSFKKLEKQADKVDFDKTDKSAKGLFATLKKVKASMVGIGAAIAALGFVKVVKEGLALSLQLERINSKLKAATSSSSQAKDEFAFLASEAERLRLNLFTAGDGFARMTAAAKDTALEGQGVRDIFTSLAETSVVLRLSQEDTVGILTALEQIISKGTVSSEELRRQLGERLPGAFQIAARSIGKTTSELDKMLRKGELVSTEFLPVFAEELRRTFGGQLDEALKGRISQLNQFANQLRFVGAEFGEGFSQELASGAATAAEGLRGMREQAHALGAVLGGAIETTVEFGKATNDISEFVRDSVIKSLLDVRVSFQTAGATILDANAKILKGLGLLIPGFASLGELAQKSADEMQEALEISTAASSEAFKTMEENIGFASKEIISHTDGLVVSYVKMLEFQIKAAELAEDHAAKLSLLALSETEAEKEAKALSEALAVVQRTLLESELAADGLTVSLDKMVQFQVKSVQLAQENANELDRLNDAEVSVESSTRILASAIEGVNSQLDSLVNHEKNAREEATALRTSWEEVAAAFERGSAEALEAAEKKFGKIFENIVQTTEALDVQANEIQDLVNAFGDYGTETEQTTKTIQKAIQKVLDAWLNSGAEVRPDLLETAEAYEVVSTAAEKSAKTSVAAAEKAAKAEEKAAKKRLEVLKSLSEAFADFSDQLNPDKADEDPRIEQLKELKEELKELEKLDILEPEQLERLDKVKNLILDLTGEINEFGKAFEKSSDQMVASTEEVDQAIRDLVASATDEFGSLNTAQITEIENILSSLRSVADAGGATSEALANSLGAVRDVLRDAGANTEALDLKILELGDSSNELADIFDILRSNAADATSEVSSLGAGMQITAASAENAVEGFVGFNNALIEFGELSPEVIEQLTQIADLLERGAKASPSFLADL